ncbi:LysM peptidoglycan-binding domain-containing protein [Kitasatospora sp. NPDC085895]|uniref:LysM peptidoglycan-binding domain-containing protein n=1 Tax=Kitasatospora sp. NPDC085895 TaxID=3155057 RepID=UPI00344C4AA1
MAARRADDPARTGAPGDRTPAVRPRRRRTAGSVAAALGALLALVALLAGLPALLGYGTLAVASTGEPATGGSAVEVLTSPDDGRLFLWALVGVGWIAWLCFALSVLIEIPAQLRGRVARRIPAFGWSQRIAAGLVGSVLALLPVAGSAFAAVPERGPQAVAAALPAAPQYAALPAAAPAAAQAAPAQDHPVYTVRDTRPADSLWSIAEHQLGSGERWQEIARLNDGRVMDDSGRRFDADRPIHPGWKLLMPGDARPDAGGAAPQQGPAPAPHHSSVTVAPGDSLSAIAQRELGSGDRWPELFEANRGVRAPDGERLTDPDVLVPGTVLAVPGAPQPAPQQPQPEQQAPQPPAQSTPAPATPAPATPAPASPAPASPAPSTPAPHSPAPSTPAKHTPPPVVPAGVGHEAHAASGDYTTALAASTVGVLLAAIMIGTVARRRGDQQRVRRPRHRITMPAPSAAAFEAELKARQNVPALELLDRALRTLARNTVRTGKRLPSLVAARITPGRTVELHLSGPAVPIAPFRAAHAANVWWCPEDSNELLSPGQAAKSSAPYPALVTLGTSPDGSVVLADLETVRLVHLSGHPDDARDVLRTLALELAHSPLADRLHLHLVGFAEDLPIAGRAAERVHRYDSLEQALGALGPRTARARATLVAAEATSPRDARSRGRSDEAWIPEIVLSAQPPAGQVPAELGRLLDAKPRSCLAVITRAPERGSGPVARWTLPATGAATLPGLHLQVELQRLDDTQYANLAELVRASGDTTQHPAPEWTLDGPGDDLEPAELPAPVPVLAAVGSTADRRPANGADDADDAAPRLIARVIGTGASPFAGTAPTATPPQPGAAVVRAVTPVNPTAPPLTPVPAAADRPPVPQPTADRPAVEAPPADRPTADLPGAGGEDTPPPPRHTANGIGRHAASGPPRPPQPAVPRQPDRSADQAPAPEPTPTHDPAPDVASPAAGTPRAAAARTDSAELLAILRSPEAHAGRSAPRLRVLGPVDITGATGTTEPAAVPRLTELAALITLRPGIDHATLDRELHPGAAHLAELAPALAASPLPGKLTRLAAWLGTSADGRPHLRTDQPDGYALAPTVSCDWDEFRGLYRRGMRSTSSTADAALAHALALVRGAPFAEAPADAYGWAEPERQDMLAAIVDTAHELAVRRLQYGDHRTAEAAIFRALAVAPDVELLHRDLFYAYASAGARDQLVRAVNRLDALSRRTGRDLDPDTVALLRDLLAA